MKSIFTLLATLFISVVSFALPYPNQTKLTISTFSNSNIKIAVDGKDYKNNKEEIEITNLKAGYHVVKVYQLKTSRGILGNNKTKYELVYNGNVYLKPQYHTDVTINRFGKALVDEQVMDRNYNQDYGNDDNRWNNDDRWDNNNGSSYNNRTMSSQSFEQFRQTLRNESFENARLNMAKSVIAQNNFTTDQVKNIIELFAFENYKLDIAKYAYTYTVDKNNYFNIANSLTYSSSKEELMKYMQNNYNP